MPAGRLLQTSFGAGEFSPRASGRSDLRAYFQGAEILENLFCLIEGPATRRPGFDYVADAKFAGKAARLIAFSRSDEKTVLIEAGDLYMRFFNGADMAALLSAGAPIEVVTPYAAANLGELYSAQSADVMWFTRRSSGFAPRVLKRFADDNWVFDVYAVTNGPFLAESFNAGTITASGVSVNVTLTASQAIFNANQAGGALRLFTQGRGRPVKKWKAEEGKDAEPDLVFGDEREHDGRVYSAASGGIGSNQPPVHEAGTLPDGGGQISWTYLHDLSGSVKLTAFISATQMTASVVERLPGAFLAFDIWAQGAMSNDVGWPKLVGVYEQRLFFASTKRQPDTIFLSRSSGFDDSQADFKPSSGSGEVLDDHAITLTLADNEINAPSWALAEEVLLLGTARGLIRITGPSRDEPISPAGAVARRVPGSKGSSPRVRGLLADGAVLYASIGGAKVYEFNDDGAFRTLTVNAEHVGAEEIVELAWAGEPHNRLFALRADGRLFAMTYDRKQEIAAWTRLAVGGTYQGGPALVESIAVLRDGDNEERLCAVIVRTVNGATKRTIERLARDWRIEADLADQAQYLDGAVALDKWNQDPAKTITLAAAAGAGHGDAATLTAIGHAPFTGKVGKVYALRSVVAGPAGEAPSVKLAQVRIDAVASGASASGVFVIGPDEDGLLVGPALAQWAETVDTIGGLSHLEGESVLVNADGMEYGPFIVAAGAVIIAGEHFARLIAGLPVSWRGRSLPIDLRFAEGAGRGRRAALNRGYIEMLETGPEQASVRVVEDGRPGPAEILGGRDDEDETGAGPRLASFEQEVHLPSRQGRKIQIEVFGSGALPATLKAITVEYSAE